MWGVLLLVLAPPYSNKRIIIRVHIPTNDGPLTFDDYYIADRLIHVDIYVKFGFRGNTRTNTLDRHSASDAVLSQS